MREFNCIDYNTALRLKEIGFNEPTAFLYREEGNHPILYPMDFESTWNCIKHLVSAPEIEQVCKWLRNIYAIYVVVTPNMEAEGPSFSVAVMSRPYNNLDTRVETSALDWEDALEAGVVEAVRILWTQTITH